MFSFKIANWQRVFFCQSCFAPYYISHFEHPSSYITQIVLQPFKQSLYIFVYRFFLPFGDPQSFALAGMKHTNMAQIKQMISATAFCTISICDKNDVFLEQNTNCMIREIHHGSGTNTAISTKPVFIQ